MKAFEKVKNWQHEWLIKDSSPAYKRLDRELRKPVHTYHTLGKTVIVLGAFKKPVKHQKNMFNPFSGISTKGGKR